jgi:predicted aspartyl protease
VSHQVVQNESKTLTSKNITKECGQERTSSPNVEKGIKTKEDNTDGEEIIEVNQLSSVSKYKITVKVEGTPVDAVVDTGSDVTIISDEVFKKLKVKPKVLKRVTLNAAGKQMRMVGRVIGPVKLGIGSQVYEQEIHVAPISQDMLLGFNFIQGKTILDFVKGIFCLNNDKIEMKMDDAKGTPEVARVTVCTRNVVPPNSVRHIRCKIESDMPDFIVEGIDDLEVLVPKTLHGGGKEATICVVNVTDNFRVLKKGKNVGYAYPVDEIMPVTEEIEQELTNSSSQGLNPSVNHVTSIDKVPNHLQKTFEESGKDLSQEQKEKLASLLITYEDVFAKSEFDLGTFTEIEHSIETGSARPIKQRMRRTPACFADEEEAHLKKMLNAGVIKESVSEWASAPVLIRKRDKSVRWCIDYRALNNVTIKDTFPLPLVDDCLDTLAGNSWFSKLDANSAYWQVRIKEEDRHKTAFVTKYGLFEHVKMGFGLCNAPATFSRVVNLVLRGLNWKTVLAFLDDILVLGKTFDEHLIYLAEALERFRQYGIKLKPKKCIFFQHQVEFLGRIVSNNKLAMAESDIKVVKDWPTPNNSKDVQRFLGLANYHRAFVPNFAEISADLYQVVGKYKFRWETEQQQAFERIKIALTEPPLLSLPNTVDDFILDTDASNVAIAGELIQLQEGQEKVISYGSYVLTPEQRNYCVTRRELLAVVRFTRQYRHYLLGRPFVLRTDHSSLTWLMNFKEPQGQLARWMEELSQYNIILKHRAGNKHANADSLSRPPVPDKTCSNYVMGSSLESLPCFVNNCHYCKKAHENWTRFTEDVDEAIPLGNQLQQKIAGGSAYFIYLDKEDDATREEYRRCASEDISRVDQEVLKTSYIKTDVTGQEGPKSLDSYTEAQITDGGGISGNRFVSNKSGGKSCKTMGYRFTEGESRWKKPNFNSNPSGDFGLHIVDDTLFTDEDNGEAHIEVVKVGEKYEILGVDLL